MIALAEVGKVLSYPRMQALRSIARIVEPQPGLPVVLSVPNDDPVAYTAVAAGADVLCVGDRHFYSTTRAVVAFCRREDIRIMDDLSLLELLPVKP